MPIQQPEQAGPTIEMEMQCANCGRYQHVPGDPQPKVTNGRHWEYMVRKHDKPKPKGLKEVGRFDRQSKGWAGRPGRLWWR